MKMMNKLRNFSHKGFLLIEMKAACEYEEKKKKNLVMGCCSETSANCVINDIIRENRNQQVLNQNERKERLKNIRNKCKIIMLYALNL